MDMAGVRIRRNHLRRRGISNSSQRRCTGGTGHVRIVGPFDRSTGRVATFPTKLYNGDKQRRFLSYASTRTRHSFRQRIRAVIVAS